jgi:hypothetical protein
MSLHVFVFLLVVCLLLSLARLGRLSWSISFSRKTPLRTGRLVTREVFGNLTQASTIPPGNPTFMCAVWKIFRIE